MTEDDVRWYRGYLAESNEKISTQKDYLAALDRISRYYGNSCVQKTKTRMPSDTRPTVDWLSFDDAKRLLDHVKTPIQEIIIHLELCMGLRRCELARLRLQDISYITVTGKGPKGEKIRMVPYLLIRLRQYRDIWITGNLS